ncbi:hypothetical protein BGW36DRAFT_152791 [Talaromyces proteolyticus]|uniref:Zn(2)-C6 fungal-type domain-containing protein n=1 Tax=Talaromyces proteolyticus TaxID=1131652 RepID=A0AAD4Q1U4_9EURO|nr:uncharacterized protein BGW36DRAFT_152791 [Talaromyces proteolyticus]KAH8698923.1 hypothetical protein BGW36DRAFT_152791 [Talaromyces proteolyticus]
MSKPRRSMPKVRTGCVTCKIRRIKCDEQKPHCAKCLQTGRECKGYLPAKKGGQVQDTGPPVSIPITTYSIPFKVPGSQADRQLLHYYCSVAAGKLAGFSDHELWTRLILQRCYHQPIIRSVVVTLSSLYQDHMRGEYDGTKLGRSPPAKSIEQIAKCHRRLTMHLGSSEASPDIALICSVFFYMFESLLGNIHQAIWHLNQGLNLLQQYQRDSAYLASSESDVMLFHLTSLLSRLDVQASFFDYDRTPVLSLVSLAERSGNVPVVPDIFLSTVQAEGILTKLQNWMMRHLITCGKHKKTTFEDIPPQIIYDRQVLDQQFRKFGTVIEKLAGTYGDDDLEWENHSLLLRIHARACHSILLERISTFGPTPRGPDDYRREVDENLRAMLSDISLFLSTSQKSTQSEGSGHFTLSSHLTPALFYAGLKTTNCETLDISLELLKHSQIPSREGVWDASTAESMLQKIKACVIQERDDQYEAKHAVLLDDTLEKLGMKFFEGAGGLNEAFKALYLEDWQGH